MFFPFLCVFSASLFLCFPFVRFYFYYIHSTVGRDSSISMATCYRLDGPGIKPPWGREFLHLSRLALGPTQPPIQWVPGLTRRESGQGVELTTQPKIALSLKKQQMRYLYSTSGPGWPVLGLTFTCIYRQYNYISIPATGFLSLCHEKW